MFPELAGWPHFALVLLLAILVSLPMHAAMAARVGVDLRSILKLLSAFGFIAIAGAKLGSLIVDGTSGPLWGLGANRLRYPGTLIALLATSPLWIRLRPRRLSVLACADLLIPGSCIAVATIRLDCIVSGCCAGGVCAVPWGIRYPVGSASWFHQVRGGDISAIAPWSLPVHPLPIYFLLLSAGLGLFLFWFARRSSFDGELVLLYLAIHEPGKAMLESFRTPPVPALQAASLLVGLVALVTLAARTAFGSRGRRRTLGQPR